ncbi:hypothetical protein AVEN_197995-1, partial [Araneus ventricosus]
MESERSPSQLPEPDDCNETFSTLTNRLHRTFQKKTTDGDSVICSRSTLSFFQSPEIRKISLRARAHHEVIL